MQTGVVITARGMASALALDAVNSCAAARAGLLRATPIPGVFINSPETNEPEAITGHQAGALTKGFQGFARLLRLAQAGLTDLARSIELPVTTQRVAAYLSLPPGNRLRQGLALIYDEAQRAEYADDAVPNDYGDSDEPEPIPPRVDELWGRVAPLIRTWKVAPSLRYVSTLGHAGVADALARAAADLAAGVVDVAVVGGVDSLLDQPTVAWLDATERLKYGGRPTGLMPGEAAAFVTLERARDVKQRGGVALAELIGGPLVQDVASLLEAETPIGRGLGDCVAVHAAGAGWAQGQPAWLVSDMNGEDFRAMDLGHAITRLRARFDSFAEPAVWMPAISFGDTASASGAVALNVVLSSFARGYAPGPAAVVASSSDGRERGALLVRTITRGS